MDIINKLLDSINRMESKVQKNQAIINIFETNVLGNIIGKNPNYSKAISKRMIAQKQDRILSMIDSEKLIEEILYKYNRYFSPDIIEKYLKKIENKETRLEVLKKLVNEKSVNEIINLIRNTEISKIYCNEEVLNEELREKSKKEYIQNPQEYLQKFRESIFDKNRDELKFILSAITIYNNTENEKVKEEMNSILATYIKSLTYASDEIINVFNQKLFKNEINICRCYDLESEKQLEFACITGEIFKQKQLKDIDIMSLDKKRLQDCVEKVNIANKGKNIESISRLEPIMKLYNMKQQEYTNQNDKSIIGTNNNIQFGIELEFKGLDFQQFEIYLNLVMKDKELQDKIGLTESEKEALNGVKDWEVCNDSSVIGGTEFKSDILKDTEQTWEEISVVSKIIESIGGYVDEDCSFHVHIDAGALGIDSKAWEMHYSIQQKDEDIIKKISCPAGERNRTDNKVFSKDIKNDPIIGKTGVKIESEEDLIEFAKRASASSVGVDVLDREKRINIAGIVRGDKYTTEDRGANGVIKYIDIRYGIIKPIRIVELAKRISIDKEFAETNKSQIEIMLNSSSEQKRKDALINLAFKEKEKFEFFNRYEKYPGDIVNPGRGEY